MSVDLSFDPGGTRAAIVFRERPGNILTAVLVRQLRVVLEDLLTAPHLRLVTIEGAGADFSFGASVPEHMAEEIRRVLPEMHALVREMVSLPAPTAAVVRGRCLGGGFELALTCDFIFAADNATFGLPEIALGVFPPAASVLLPVRVGAARAADAILTGTPRPAEYWRQAGLVAWTKPEADLSAAVQFWYEQSIAHYSAEALRHAVRVARAPVAAAVEAGLAEAERLYLNDLMVTHDANEGVRAFIEKRPARWKDE
jgi:cyclohexa-1,5-dienecarbonyl-CoA hydratase